MAKASKDKEEKIELEEATDISVKTEKEELLELYDRLKALDVRSISDLENKISRAE